jgi:iron complex transport system ATP-binding protein
MSHALRAENVTVTRGSRPVVTRAAIAFEPGTVTALVGPNGAGKSSLLLALAGLLPIAEGTVALDGRAVTLLSPAERARRIALLPQRRDTAWPLAVRDVVLLGRFPASAMFGRASAEDEAIASQAMRDCDVLALADRPIDRLSGGEQARVLLARALAVDAPVLLADEPLAGLDPAHQFAVLDILKRLAARGRTVVIALHELSLVARYADHVAVMERGAIVVQGTPDEALDDATLARVFGVGASRLTVDGETLFVPRRLDDRALSSSPDDRE